MDPPPPPQSTCQWDSRMHGGAPTGATSSPPPRWRCASRSGRCSTARWEQKKNQILGYGENGVWHMGEMGIYLRNLTAPTLLPCSPHVTTPISTTSHRTYPLRDVTSHCSPFLPICHPPLPPPPTPNAHAAIVLFFRTLPIRHHASLIRLPPFCRCTTSASPSRPAAASHSAPTAH